MAEPVTRIDPFSLPRPDRKVETREFTENGVAFSVSFIVPNSSDMSCATEACDQMAETYIDGSDVREAAPFPDVDVKPSRILFFNCALAYEIQQVTDPRLRYSREEWAVMSVRLPRVWGEICTWLADLAGRWKGDPKKA